MFDVRVIGLSDMCRFCVSVRMVWTGVVERSFPVLGDALRFVGKLESAITLFVG